MPKESYAEIVKRTKNPVERDEAALNQIVNERPSERAMRLAAESRKASAAEQAAANADKILAKSPTDEFSDLRTAIDITHHAMEVLTEINTIPNLSEFNRDSLKNEYRVLQNLYFRMLREEHDIFAKVFQGDEE